MYRNDAKRFYRALTALEHDPRVRQMERFRQHKGNSTLNHCHNVAVTGFRMAQRLGWDIDEEALARGALLHDFHLYTRKSTDWRHLFRHPRLALKNAEEYFSLSEKERNIITSHMWPLTVLHPPLSREAFLVMLADKRCAFREMRGQHSRL